jgi:hypothetical protein
MAEGNQAICNHNKSMPMPRSSLDAAAFGVSPVPGNRSRAGVYSECREKIIVRREFSVA